MSLLSSKQGYSRKKTGSCYRRSLSMVKGRERFWE